MVQRPFAERRSLRHLCQSRGEKDYHCFSGNGQCTQLEYGTFPVYELICVLNWLVYSRLHFLLLQNFKFDTNEYRNPVKHNYPGREDELSLHSGFALYLLRKRKDTGMSKMDEIFEKVEQVGKELAPDGDYNLCITGHSLGGALATLCGFYFGAKPRFAHLNTIYIWTFAAPRVGTQGTFPVNELICVLNWLFYSRFNYLLLHQPLFMRTNTWKGLEEFGMPDSRALMILFH